jgi:hypothetical protein
MPAIPAPVEADVGRWQGEGDEEAGSKMHHSEVTHLPPDRPHLPATLSTYESVQG